MDFDFNHGIFDNIQIQPSLRAELLLVYFPAIHYNINCNKTFQHQLYKSFFEEIQEPVRGVGREGMGREEITRSGTWGRCSYNLRSDQHACYSAVSSSSLGPSLMFLSFLTHFLQMKCMMSASADIMHLLNRIV